MSQPSFASNPGGVVVQKPKWDVYTTMLLLSAIAIVIAIGVLWLEMSRYNYDIKANAGKLQRAAWAAPVQPRTLAERDGHGGDGDRTLPAWI